MTKIIRFPMGNAEVLALTATGAQALTISDTLTIVDGVTVIATGARTLNLTLAADLLIGSKIVVQSRTTAVETTVFGTLMTGLTITGVAGTTICTEFVFDGTIFKQSGAQVQID